MRKAFWNLLLVALLLCCPAQAAEKEVGAGYLRGVLLTPDVPRGPLALIIPGSGAVTRDGDIFALGIPGTYKLLAEGLAGQGIASARVDKRGMFSSAMQGVNPNNARLRDYADDARLWVDTLRQETGRECVWLIGHSEGALTAMLAAQKPEGICGLVLASPPGRKLGDILRAQMGLNFVDMAALPLIMRSIRSLEKGDPVDDSALPAQLQAVFRREAQGLLMDVMRYDPAGLISGLSLPILIVQGEADLQITPLDARLLHQAGPGSSLLLLPGVTHTLKRAGSSSLEDYRSTYSKPGLGLPPELINAVAAFMLSGGKAQ